MTELSPAGHVVPVAIESPRHTGLGTLDYLSEQPLAPGTLVLAPLGKREVPGLVWDGNPAAARTTAILRPLSGVLTALPPLPADWRALIAFAAG